MAHVFSKGDKVVITTKNTTHEGVQGVVESSYEDNTYIVELETGQRTGFFERELALVDPEREALIRLAETLDLARQQANAIDIYVIQSQRGVYGQISQSLHDTLEQILDSENEDENNTWEAGKLYASLLDGNSVREALKKWKEDR